MNLFTSSVSNFFSSLLYFQEYIDVIESLKLDLVSSFNQGLDTALEVLGQFYINDDTRKAEENNDFIDMLILEIGKYYN